VQGSNHTKLTAFHAKERRKYMKWMFRTALLAATLTLPALLAACGSTTTAPVAAPTELELLEASIDAELAIPLTLFVGKVAGSNAYVAITNRDGKVEAYICDGTTTTISVATWFEGSLKDGVLAGTATDGSSLSGTLTGETISGTFKSPNNSSLTFTALKSNQAITNLWQAFSDFGNPTAGTQHLGWIVLPDGTQRGGKSPSVEVVEQINPSTGQTSDDGLPVGGGAPPVIVPTESELKRFCRELSTQYILLTVRLTFGGTKEQRDATRTEMKNARGAWHSNGCDVFFGKIGKGNFTT
jgi:hypothetical protein